MPTTGARILSYEPLIRLGVFSLVFAAMALWEAAAPFRRHDIGRSRRWPGNVGVVVLNTLLARLLLPAGVVGMALYAEAQHWGIFNAWSVSAWLAVPVAVVELDLAIYAQHVIFHQVPPLWRLHRMHHADLELDVTTGARFHPVEIVISLALKAAVVVALGAPAVAVLVFEVLLNATSMFNHANVRLPGWLEPIVRALIVTPDMHRVHHSVLRHETNSNYGFNLAVWDRLFGTYRAAPEGGRKASHSASRPFAMHPSSAWTGCSSSPSTKNPEDNFAALAVRRRHWARTAYNCPSSRLYRVLFIASASPP